MALAYLSRKETFSASHRLHSDSLSPAENKRLFGKCNSENGHGHNYGIEVTVRGELDPETGLVFNLNDLKLAMKDGVLDKFDHKHLNLDVAEFRSLNPTAENIAKVCWDLLKP